MKDAQCHSLLEFWGVERDAVSVIEAENLNGGTEPGVFLNTVSLTPLNAIASMEISESCRPHWMSEDERLTLFINNISASPVDGQSLVSFQIGDVEYPAIVFSDVTSIAGEHHRRVVLNFDIEKVVDSIILEDYASSKRPLAALIPFNCARLVPRKLRPAIKRAQAYFARQIDIVSAPLRHKSDGGNPDALQSFPSWPIDKSVETLRYLFLRAIELVGGTPMETAPFWPDGKRFAVSLTHDIDSKAGLKLVDEVARIEERYFFASTWNIVGKLRLMSGDVAERLIEAGHEIGLHGSRHDAQFPFLTKAKMMERLDECSDFIERFNIVGFRSPSLLRSRDMFDVLAQRFEYDSSVPDTAKLSPHPQVNGCCTIFPYMIDDLLEIPITLPLDSSLIFLGYDSEEIFQIWKDKIEWIESVGGLAVLCTHVESSFLLKSEEMMAAYGHLLDWLFSKDNVWIASMSDIARWWQKRLARNYKR